MKDKIYSCAICGKEKTLKPGEMIPDCCGLPMKLKLDKVYPSLCGRDGPERS